MGKGVGLGTKPLPGFVRHALILRLNTHLIILYLSVVFRGEHTQGARYSSSAYVAAICASIKE